MRKITTHTGDKGVTNTLSAKGLSKGDIAIKLMAQIDHLNSILGGCRYELQQIQPMLFTFMGRLSMLDSDIDTCLQSLQHKVDENAPFGGWNTPNEDSYIEHMARTQTRIIETYLPEFVETYGEEFQSYMLFFNTLSNYIFELIQTRNLQRR